MIKTGTLLAEQVERANAKRREKPMVTLVAEFPGDGSDTNLDWWLRQVNRQTRQIGIAFDFADPDARAVMVDGSANPVRLAQLEQRLNEAQAYINDLELHMQAKVDKAVAEALEAKRSELSPEEEALRAVDTHGSYVDTQGNTWTDIRTEAKRIGSSYITLWRAAKGQTQSASIDVWIVGTTNAGGDRLLVKKGSYVKGKRK